MTDAFSDVFGPARGRPANLGDDIRNFDLSLYPGAKAFQVWDRSLGPDQALTGFAVIENGLIRALQCTAINVETQQETRCICALNDDFEGLPSTHPGVVYLYFDSVSALTGGLACDPSTRKILYRLLESEQFVCDKMAEHAATKKEFFADATTSDCWRIGYQIKDSALLFKTLETMASETWTMPRLAAELGVSEKDFTPYWEWLTKSSCVNASDASSAFKTGTGGDMLKSAKRMGLYS